MTNPGHDSLNRRVPGWWRTVGILSQILCLVSGLAVASLWTYYDYTRPHAAEPSAGRIYALQTHRSIVYLTGQEQFMLNLLIWIAAPIFVLAILLEVIFVRPLRRPQ